MPTLGDAHQAATECVALLGSFPPPIFPEFSGVVRKWIADLTAAGDQLARALGPCVGPKSAEYRALMLATEGPATVADYVAPSHHELVRLLVLNVALTVAGEDAEKAAERLEEAGLPPARDDLAVLSMMLEEEYCRAAGTLAPGGQSVFAPGEPTVVVSPSEAAKRLRVSTKTFLRWVQNKRIRAEKVSAKSYRVAENELPPKPR